MISKPDSGYLALVVEIWADFEHSASEIEGREGALKWGFSTTGAVRAPLAKGCLKSTNVRVFLTLPVCYSTRYVDTIEPSPGCQHPNYGRRVRSTAWGPARAARFVLFILKF